MQQTEKYQFNLIEGSDLFLPDALNENMEKVEGVLAEHRAEASDALAEHRAEASGALAELTASTAARFAAQPKIHIQTWKGTGEKTRTLTFPFQPQAVLLIPQVSDSLMPIAVEYGLERGYRYGYANISRYTYLVWKGTSVTMLDRTETDGGAGAGAGAFNKSDTPYVALAIG